MQLRQPWRLQGCGYPAGAPKRPPPLPALSSWLHTLHECIVRHNRVAVIASAAVPLGPSDMNSAQGWSSDLHVQGVVIGRGLLQ